MRLKSEYVSVRTAVVFFVVSMCCTAALFFGFLLCRKYIMNTRGSDTRYDICVLAQQCESKEPLSFAILNEMLSLSCDRPINIYRTTNRYFEKRLRSYSIIDHAWVSFLLPNVVLVRYSLREPIALLADVENRAIDREGVIFPIRPFIKPKLLPQIRCGKILSAMRKEHIELAFSVLDYVQSFPLQLKYIDIEEAFCPSANREILIGLAAEDAQYRVRLQNTHWKEGVELFYTLYPHYIQEAYKKQKPAEKPHDVLLSSAEEIIVDVRLPRLAFVR